MKTEEFSPIQDHSREFQRVVENSSTISLLGFLFDNTLNMHKLSNVINRAGKDGFPVMCLLERWSFFRFFLR